MAVKTLNDDILRVYTYGNVVKSIFTYGEQVWPSGPVPSGNYYISWSPILTSGTFSINGSTYNFSQYPGYFSEFDGVITASAFKGNGWGLSLSSIETNAIEISESAFYDIESLKTLKLSKCKRIGNSAFAIWNGTPSSLQSNLYSLSLPKCEYIGDHAFEYRELSTINLPRCSYIGEYAFYKARIIQLSLPKCKYIGNGAFKDNLHMSSISLPECEYIGQAAFNAAGQHSLYSVYLPKCKYIGSGAFVNNNGLYSISLPECEFIDTNAFANEALISELYLPKCSFIGSNAFRGYSTGLDLRAKFSSINLPLCTYISQGAFMNCINVSSISLPMCEYIGNWAFESCGRLSSVVLPVCSYLANSVFKDCTILSEITLCSISVCLLESSVFTGTPIEFHSGSIYVPTSLVSAYKSATNWSEYSDIIIGY